MSTSKTVNVQASIKHWKFLTFIQSVQKRPLYFTDTKAAADGSAQGTKGLKTHIDSSNLNRFLF